MKAELDEKWIKASIIGTIWAASEIVLGSFLHNLRIPFSGNVLTAIGIIILVSASFKWTEKGLFWRAGLICAVLKTMSPSAVIFGPMIAIFSEALLMELFIRLLGRSMAGYITGAIFAMSWNLFQKIANYIIFYGNNIIEVYTNLLKLAQNQLKIQTDMVWMPIIILLVVYALFGLFAAIIGIRVGRRIINTPAAAPSERTISTAQKVNQANAKEFNYSLPWLFIDFALLVFSFILLSYAPWPVWSIVIIVIVTIWAVRYKRALRQLSKPGLWIFFVFITLITAFVFTKASPGENKLFNGLLTGFQMNFRAVVIIVGFSVLGTELYNPVIRNYFLKTAFKNLPIALELSAESLPSFIAGIPDLKTIIRDPVSVFCGFFSHADRRLEDIKSTQSCRVFIVSSSIGGGKTSFVRSIVKQLTENNVQVGGVISERVIENSEDVGYDLIDLAGGERKRLMRKGHIDGLEIIGRFSIYPEGFATGKKILDNNLTSGCNIIVIDEVGNLELRDRGWSDSISQILKKNQCYLLMTVRDNLIDEVVSKWNINNYIVFNMSETDSSTAFKSMKELMGFQSSMC